MSKYNVSRRTFLKMSVIGLSSVVAACTPSSPPPPEAAPTTVAEPTTPPPLDVKPVEVIFWHNTGETPVQKRLDSLAATFHEQHPNIVVKCEYMGTGREFLEKVITSLAGDVPPHLSFGYPYWAVSFLEDGASVSIDDYIQDDPEFNKDDLQDATWPAVTWKGHIVAMPQTYHPFILYYNTQAFDEIGAKVPANWEEMLEVSAALTRDADGDGKLDRWAIDFGFDDARRWICFVRNNGGRFMDETQTEFAWNSEEALEALQLWDKLFNEIQAVPLGDVEQGFEMGFIGMTTAGPWRIEGYLSAKAPFSVAVLPWRKTPLAEANVDTVIMYKTSNAERAAAWEWLKAFVGPAYQKQVAMEGYYYPLLKSIVADEEYQKWVETVPVIKQLVELQGQWTTMENTKAGEEPLDILNRELELALRRTKGLQEALNDATAEANALLV